MIEPMPVSAPLTPEQYLAFERAAQERHEYVAGHVHLLAGARATHMRVNQNLALLLINHLQGHPCEVFASEMKLRPTPDRFYYPDLLVCCQDVDGDADVVTDARYIVEVSSPSTQRTDLHEKADAYWQVPSLEAYILVVQGAVQVVVMRRAGGASHEGRPDWTTEILTQPEDMLRLEGIGFTASLADVYARTGLI
jgi:Uma2 family endonuclease